MIQAPANAYNVSRIMLWVWGAFIFGTVAIFSISMKYKGLTFAYDTDRRKGLNGYITIFILYTVFCIYQILLVPVVSIEYSELTKGQHQTKVHEQLRTWVLLEQPRLKRGETLPALINLFLLNQ